MNIYQHNNLFLDNKYTKWYYSIISKAQNSNRVKLKRDNSTFVYYENHHILPKCMFPEYAKLSEYKWNGVLLTAKEHFICHALLCKMTEGSNFFQMLKAYYMMNCKSDKHQQIRTSNKYMLFKNELSICYSLQMKSLIRTNIHKQNISIALTGLKRTDKTKQLIKTIKKEYYKNNNGSMFGKNHSEETKEKFRIIARNRAPISEETRHKMSESQKDRKHTDDTKLKMSKLHKGQNNSNFKGYYKTPWGVFDSPKSASEHANINISRSHVYVLCKKRNVDGFSFIPK